MVTHVLEEGRQAYLVPAMGAVAVDDTGIETRAGAAVRDVRTVTLIAKEDSEILLVDLP